MQNEDTQMKATDLMTVEPKTCASDTHLAVAAELMLAGNCGLLPVLDQGTLADVVTDRDLYIALATRNRQAAGSTQAFPDRAVIDTLQTIRSQHHRSPRIAAV